MWANSILFSATQCPDYKQLFIVTYSIQGVMGPHKSSLEVLPFNPRGRCRLADEERKMCRRWLSDLCCAEQKNILSHWDQRDPRPGWHLSSMKRRHVIHAVDYERVLCTAWSINYNINQRTFSLSIPLPDSFFPRPEWGNSLLAALHKCPPRVAHKCKARDSLLTDVRVANVILWNQSW